MYNYILVSAVSVGVVGIAMDPQPPERRSSLFSFTQNNPVYSHERPSRDSSGTGRFSLNRYSSSTNGRDSGASNNNRYSSDSASSSPTKRASTGGGGIFRRLSRMVGGCDGAGLESPVRGRSYTHAAGVFNEKGELQNLPQYGRASEDFTNLVDESEKQRLHVVERPEAFRELWRNEVEIMSSIEAMEEFYSRDDFDFCMRATKAVGAEGTYLYDLFAAGSPEVLEASMNHEKFSSKYVNSCQIPGLKFQICGAPAGYPGLYPINITPLMMLVARCVFSAGSAIEKPTIDKVNRATTWLQDDRVNVLAPAENGWTVFDVWVYSQENFRYEIKDLQLEEMLYDHLNEKIKDVQAYRTWLVGSTLKKHGEDSVLSKLPEIPQILRQKIFYFLLGVTSVPKIHVYHDKIMDKPHLEKILNLFDDLKVFNTKEDDSDRDE